MKSTINRVWNPKGNMEINLRENGLFLFRFNYIEDKTKIQQVVHGYFPRSQLSCVGQKMVCGCVSVAWAWGLDFPTTPSLGAYNRQTESGFSGHLSSHQIQVIQVIWEVEGTSFQMSSFCLKRTRISLQITPRQQ